MTFAGREVMKAAVYEPSGIVRIEQIPKPTFLCGKVWFTQRLSGGWQLHVGILEGEVLKVWKSRDIHPRIKLVQIGWHYHARNPILDEPIWKRIVRVPFLVPTPVPA